MKRLMSKVCGAAILSMLVAGGAFAEDDPWLWDGAEQGALWFGMQLPRTDAPEKVIWKNVSLDDVDLMFAMRRGGAMSTGLTRPVTLSRTSEKWTVQFQMFDDKYIKTVTAEFTQSGDDVVGKAAKVHYGQVVGTSSDYARFAAWGKEVKSGNGFTGGTVDDLDYAGSNRGYNVHRVAAVRKDGSGGVTLTSENLVTDRDWVVSNGVVRIKLELGESLAFAKDIRGNAALFIDGSEPVSGLAEDAWPLTNQAAVIDAKWDPEGFTPTTCEMGGSAIAEPARMASEIRYVKRVDGVVRAQAQCYDDGFVKCVGLEFSANGDGRVRVLARYAKYKSAASFVDCDFDLNGSGEYGFSAGVVASNVYGYGVRNIGWKNDIPCFTLGDANTPSIDHWDEAQIVVRNARLRIASINAIPKNCSILVMTGGIIEHAYAGTSLGASEGRGSPLLMLDPGSEYRISQSWPLCLARIFADGARISANGICYLHRLFAGNGTTIDGSNDCRIFNPDRIADYSPYFVTYGTGCTISPSQFKIVGRTSNVDVQTLWICADTTIDTQLGTLHPSYRLKRICKSGTGTLTLNKPSAGVFESPVTISEGKVLLTANEALKCLSVVDANGKTIENPGIVLDGGTLELAGGVTNTVYSLGTSDRVDTSELVLGVGAQLFATNALASAFAGPLSISGELRDDGGNLRIGRSASLTATDLAPVRYVEGEKKRRVRQLENGGICRSCPFLLIFR